METLVAILLYLRLVNPGGVYHQTEIDRKVLDNKPRIDQIIQNKPLMDQIHHEYDDDVIHITIINDDQTR